MIKENELQKWRRVIWILMKWVDDKMIREMIKGGNVERHLYIHNIAPPSLNYSFEISDFVNNFSSDGVIFW